MNDDRDDLDFLNDDVVDRKDYPLSFADADDVDTEAEQVTMDFNNPDYSFKPAPTHNWKQRGYYVHCDSCELGHGVHIGKDKIMVGVDEKGEPILKDRNALSFA